MDCIILFWTGFALYKGELKKNETYVNGVYYLTDKSKFEYKCKT